MRRAAGISRNVVVLGVVSLLADVSSDMVMPLLPAFLLTLGADAAFIGVVEGVAEGTAALLKYVSGRWADRVRRLLPLAIAGYALAVLARPFLAIARAPWQVLVIRSLDRVGKGIRTSPRDKLLAASVPRERLAEAFAFHRGMDHAGAAIGPLLAAGLLLLWPEDVRRVFLMAAIPGTLAVLALFAVLVLFCIPLCWLPFVIDGCQEITLNGEGRSPNHRGRLPGLAHSGKTGGDRRGPRPRPQAHPQGIRRVHELGRDQLGDPARRVLEHPQRSAALLCGPRREEEL